MAAPPSQSRLPGRQGLRSRPTSMFEVPSEHMKRLQQIGEGANINTMPPPETGSTSKLSKRRSLLPQGFARRKGSQDERPSPAPIPEDTATAGRSTDERKAMPPPPKPSRLSSLRAPGRAATTTTHSRTSSKDSITGTAPAPKISIADQFTSRLESGLKRSSSTRLPQTPTLRGPTPPVTAPLNSLPRGRAGSNVSTASTMAHKRASMSISKTAAPSSARPSDTNKTSPKSPPSSSLARPRSSRTQMAPPSRPTFSTYQQHYSPAKSALPKPPIPGIKATKPAAMNVEEEEIPITFDIALEQIELLQLSLLHQSSAQALREYEASAKQQLSARHAKLRKEYEGIRAQEQERRRLANLATLESWCADPALLAEHLQTLGRVASDLRSHTEPGSRYSEMTETFEKWATSAESVLLDEHPTHFVEALPDSWRAVHTALALKLRSLQRDISTLPPIPQNFEPDMTPSLQILMENCSSLVDSSLKELELMTKLQKEVLQRGKERIDEQIDILVSTTDATGDKENWVPVWQSVS